jgi:hypothetical protein
MTPQEPDARPVRKATGRFRRPLAVALLLCLLLQSCTCISQSPPGTRQTIPARVVRGEPEWLPSAFREIHRDHVSTLDASFEPFVCDDTEYVLCTYRILVGEIWQTCHEYFACHLPTRAISRMPAGLEKLEDNAKSAEGQR